MLIGMSVGDRGIYGGVKLELKEGKEWKEDRCKKCYFEGQTTMCFILRCHPSRNINTRYEIYESKRKKNQKNH